MFKRLLVLLLLVSGTLAYAQTDDDVTVDLDDDPYAVMVAILQSATQAAEGGSINAAFFEAIAASGDTRFVAPLVDIAYFTRTPQLRDLNEVVFDTLAALTGEDYGIDWRAYFEWAGANDVELPPRYTEFKGFLFSTLIDPEFERFFAPDMAATVNLSEVVWGGVRVDGIPSLVNARQISPEAALQEGIEFERFCQGDNCTYPQQDEFVFGVVIDGDARAYPLRLLNWHEMFNDVIGSQPLYDAPDGEVVCEFRAPVRFAANQRSGDEWVRISGQSAGCPAEGWLANPAQLQWDDGEDWATVSVEMPTIDEEPVGTAVGSVPGTPVMLAYCTLCGSGVLYNPVVEIDGETVALEFGSTGMLMRSNKLMYDRTTDTVWNAMTGEPAFGPLVEAGVTLERLPVIVTTWSDWLEQHPNTSVLSLDTGFQRNYTNGAAYADYFNDPDFLMFPVWQTDLDEQAAKDMVFTLNIDGTPKAYPLEAIIPEGVTNDTLAGEDVVLVSRASPTREFFEPGGAEVRAYARADRTFAPGETHREVIDADGAVWQVTEDALVSPTGETLDRLPGHLAFWFGWYAFYPETLVYEGAES